MREHGGAKKGLDKRDKRNREWDREAQCCVGQLRRSYKRNRDAGREKETRDKEKKWEEWTRGGSGPKRKEDGDVERERERDESLGVSQL